uniref:Uncharacterized protein n=1 Tax=Globodera rostochiensis TaxID=31243 RepID=A0A914H511_GLORO
MEMQQLELNLPTSSDSNDSENKSEIPLHSKESVAFYRDPYNKPELEHTLRGAELVLFVFFYILGLCTIVVLLEKLMPVVWTDEQHFLEQRRREEIFNRQKL